MLFNSAEFLYFFIAVVALYYLLHRTLIMPMLLIASAFFYAFFIPKYLLILLVVIAIDYSSGIAIERFPLRKKIFLTLSIVSNLGILFFFKYYNFVAHNTNSYLHTHFTLTNWILPIGLSFHPFQSLSYVIEVYKGKYTAERNLGYFALYVLYFPQLVAGPIERPQNVIHQLKTKNKFQFENIWQGLRLILWGLFKKAVVADHLSYYVNCIFETPHTYTGMQVLIGMLAFSVQIYCDFSGYSDMAIGASRCLGIQLMTNFNRPYAASNIQEFWSRWHISLSTWFRDYVYIPLGGNKQGKLITLRNVFIVFVLSGAWHGAGWNFIAWGLLHALFIILFILLSQKNNIAHNRIKKYASWLFTIALVTLCWTFFRATSLRNAIDVLLQLKTIHLKDALHVFDNLRNFTFSAINYGIVLCSIIFIFLVEAHTDALLLYFDKKPKLDIALVAIISLLILFAGVFTKQQFIYFQF